MAEPHASSAVSVAALSMASLGALIGPTPAAWVLIVFGGLFGGFLAATSVPTSGTLGALIVVLRGTAAAILFTSVVALLASSWLSAPLEILLLPTAGLIGWQFDRLKDLAVQAISRRVGGGGGV